MISIACTRYADVYAGDERWQAIEITGGDTYSWPAASTYIQNPPYFIGMTMTPVPLKDVVAFLKERLG